jgi:dipeptidyl-peptidase-4
MEIRGIPAATAWLALALGIAGTPVGHGTPPASAQERAVAEAVSPDQASTKSTRLRLTVESTFGSSDFATSAYTARWRADGSSWTIVRPDDEERDELWEVDAESGADRLLVSADMLRPAVGSESISLDDYAFTADGLRVLILTDSEMIWRRSRRGRYWVLDLDTHALRAVSDDPGPQMLGKFSPDGRFVSFVREHDLFLADLSTGEERALTTDGDDEIINATTDWVYEEELSFYDAYRWSPDGRRIAYWRFDQSPIKPFYMIDDLELYPEPIPVRYPKTGTANSRVRVGSLELETGATTWFDIGADPEAYVARMDWAESSDEVAIQVLNRHQNRLELLIGQASSGATEAVLSETDEAWVDVQDYMTWLDSGRRFIWASERDGFNHLYLYERDGTLVRQLTMGRWDVTSVDAVDEADGIVFFTAAAPSARMRSVFAVSLAGGEAQTVVGGAGTHSVDFSPDARWFINRHSRLSVPTVTDLRASDGSLVRVLEDNAALAARLDSAGIREPEFFEVEAADGTPLHAYMIKPPDFDPSRTYPLLLYVYGGPGSQTVVDGWGGTRFVWHQLLAQRGFIVASVDNRGTGGRGRDFKKQVYLQLGKLEAEDQLAAARQLGALPFVDASRIGIWGWSYGGYMTLLASFLSQGELSLGMSIAPVTSWDLYDTIYTERFMRTPAENPSGYSAGSPITHAAKLEIPLLLVHGTGDDNVHFQNSVQLVKALEDANRQFSFRIYPNKAHALAGPEARVNLFSMLTEYIQQHLGAAARPTS